jgi:hypothetical protein
MKYLIWCIPLFTLLLLSCHKDQFDSDINVTNPDPKINLLKTIYGRITNQKGDPVPNTQITLRNKSYWTDQNGYFRFQDYISTERSILKFQHPVFYTSYIQVKAFEKGDIPVSIQLNYISNKQAFSSKTSISLNDISGLQLDFEKNAISNPDSSVFDGLVYAGLKELNPIDKSEERNTPTDFIGFDEKNQITGLLCLGMFQLNLKDNLNRELIIQKPAKIKIPVLPGQIQFAENQLHLWNLDVTKGIWIKKGIATRSGNYYEGFLTGNEFWMVAKEVSVSKLSGQLSSLKPLPILKIEFNNTINIYNRTCYIDDYGNYEVYLPNTSNYSMNIFNGYEELLFSNQIPGINSGIVLPFIDLQRNGCFPIQFNITSCPNVDLLSNWIIVREIGNINDQIFYPGLNNNINEIIKVHKKGSYILFPSIGSQQYFNYGEPILININSAGSFKTIEVCENPGGQSLLLLDKNDPENTLSHFLPYNNLVFEESSPNNGILHLSWIDTYDQNTYIEYKLDCKLVNGKLEFGNREIKMKLTGRPDRIIFLELTPQSEIILNRNPLKANYFKIDITNLLAILENGEEYHANLNGHYFSY